MKNRLMTPGPVPVPPDSLLAMAQPMIHHRTDKFEKIMAELPDLLRYVFQTKNDVITLTSSSTGAMESAVVNLLSYDDHALVIGGGKFGERWGKLCEAYNIDFDFIDVKYGNAVDPKLVDDKLRSNPSTKCVYATLCETSTGVAHDIQKIGEIVSKYENTLLVADAVSGLGAVDLKTDDWHVDVVVSGSQKGLMTPPGLAFISLNDKAWEAVEKSDLPKYYFDLKKAKESAKTNQTPWTCSISLILALRESLVKIKQEGLENVLARHARLASATRAGIQAIGLELFASSPSNALTSVKVPNGIDGKKLIKYIEDRYDVTFAGGQESLAGKIFRIAHLGYVDDLDIVSAISALEMSLPKFGFKVSFGEGIRAVEEVLSNT
ncbi:TPA: alanine--glyoxylate aminotransferase family protein [Candidatus Poribacteria bacterium]|nr:alanine--glyoxylate aminotransferase family protein [Candidatus Poribacteria bacterium]